MENQNNLSEEFIVKSINTLRFLSADAVQKANSGHLGLPMGAATIAYIIWMRHLKHNPINPGWPDRDRFILSGGHGSILLYSILHLTGYDLSLDEIKNFRQWGSKTPGHPERGVTPGVEVTTGPLGQGFGNGVGMAIAEEHLASVFNKPDFKIVDHYIYAIVTDGDLMEGVASEAASLAGHLKLGKLIYVYDDNRISIDGSTEITFTEDRAARFLSYGWQVLSVENGNDPDALDSAILKAKSDPRPSLIVARTEIGYGLPTRQNTAKAHGEPPGDDELEGAKLKLGWPVTPRFYVPDEVQKHFRQCLKQGKEAQEKWDKLLMEYRIEFPDLAKEFERRIAGKLPQNWEKDLPIFNFDTKGIATRVASGKVINALSKTIPELIGGSADLTPSNKTWIDGLPSFQFFSREGRNFHFGVREHGMGSVLNGMAVHGGVIPYGGTFLVFSDYMKASIRLSALSDYPCIWIFTHDSIGLGEDGPTHQPVEHIASLRGIPNLVVIRPADANEVSEAWRVALQRRNGPTALLLSRQNLPVLDRSKFGSASDLGRGAYILKDFGENQPELLLMASGSEVDLIINAAMKLADSGLNVRVVSFPSWELFEKQDENYMGYVFPANILNRIAVEAGIQMGWEKWVGNKGRVISVDRFGASAPYEILYEKYGLTVDNIVNTAYELIT